MRITSTCHIPSFTLYSVCPCCGKPVPDERIPQPRRVYPVHQGKTSRCWQSRPGQIHEEHRLGRNRTTTRPKHPWPSWMDLILSIILSIIDYRSLSIAVRSFFNPHLSLRINQNVSIHIQCPTTQIFPISIIDSNLRTTPNNFQIYMTLSKDDVNFNLKKNNLSSDWGHKMNRDLYNLVHDRKTGWLISIGNPEETAYVV